MPELPEVESVRRSLLPHLIGARIASATLLRPDICESFNARGQPITTRPANLLLGARITQLARRGKQLAVIADDGRTLCVHLGMTGQVLAQPREAVVTHTHVHARWTTHSGTTILFRDPRRFGGLWTFPSEEALRRARWSTLGPDALDASGPALSAAGRKSLRPIKALLLDQSVLAGVGNIYADEALFAARIPPRLRADRLAAASYEALAASIRAVLTRAIQAGGSTLRDYRDANGQSGLAARNHAVYGRAGQPCLICTLPLATAVIAQRTTVWCKQCQRAANIAPPPRIQAAKDLTYPHGGVEMG